MLAKDRIGAIDVNSTCLKERLKTLEAEAEKIQKEIKRVEDLIHTDEVERRTLVTIMNVYKDIFPGEEVNIVFTPKTPKKKSKTSEVTQDEVTEMLATIFK